MHAIAVLTACVLALMVGSALPFALGAAFSMGALIVGASGRWTASGRFGPANTVTALRLLGLLGLLGLAGHLPSAVLLVGLWVVFAMDAVDGRVARRWGCASAFGASFDMEVDALFVLGVGYFLQARGGIGGWVLIPGALRYVYVLCLALLPPSGIDRGRSRLGRFAFLITGSCLLLASWLGEPACTIVAAVGTLVSCASFGRSFIEAYPGLPHLPRLLLVSGRRVWGVAAPTVGFLVAWAVLNLAVNVRYPAAEPTGWYFLPNLDVAALLGVFAVLGLAGLGLPWWARVPLVVTVLLVRLLRFGDGITGLYFGQVFNSYLHLPLVGELLRYARSTLATWKLVALAIVALGAVALLVVSTHWALSFAASYLRRRRHLWIWAVATLPFVLVSLFLRQDNRYNTRYTGAFAASSLPRLGREATFLLNVYDEKASKARAIAEAQARLQGTPARLERLHGANVYLFFVESYGATVTTRLDYVKQSLPALQRMEANLARQGFATASGQLDSATYGGMSWLAHATLLTGVRVANQLDYDLLGVSRPRTMARIFHEAGYQSVLVQPNTERRSPGKGFYDFDATFDNWDFDYAGPSFAWATMPDQYVIDFIQRHVVEKIRQPVFVTYALVSSHAPWSEVPTLVADWSRIGNGHIFRSHPLHRAPMGWPIRPEASGPYLRSILYELEVLESYLTELVRDEALIIVLGDHQPVSELTDDSQSWAVPVHVISRAPRLVEPFLARGYRSGMVPADRSVPMESFLIDLLRDFSGGES